MREQEKYFIPSSVLAIFASTGLLVIFQQQLLLNRPPKLREISIQQIRSGSAALDLKFSRPMQVSSVRRHSRIDPQTPHRWLGIGTNLRLLLESNRSIDQPLSLNLGGSDYRGIKLKSDRWWWDPRPHLLAVVLLPEGEQLQMRRIDGSWVPLSPVMPKIIQLEPLGNGRGVAFVSIDEEWGQRVWLRQLNPSAFSSIRSQLHSPRLGPLLLLTHQPQVFAFLSSNQHGELLVQVGGEEPGSDQIWVQDDKGKKRELFLNAAGPMRLIPDGSGLVMPLFDGIELLPLLQDELRSASQILPGARELKAFCYGSGRAVLANLLPGYRDSIELVIPGFAPKKIWTSEKSLVMAAGCDNGGHRIWIVLRKKTPRPTDVVVLMDSDGQTLNRVDLGSWLLAPDSVLDFDPVGDQLLLTFVSDNRKIFRSALIQSDDLKITTIDRQIKMSRWLPAGSMTKFP